MKFPRLFFICLIFLFSRFSIGQEAKKTPLVDFNFDPNGNFGVSLTEESYKLLQKQNFGNVPIGKGIRDGYGRLTFAENGSTNNLMTMIDGVAINVKFPVSSFRELEQVDGEGKSWKNFYSDKTVGIDISQTVKIVEGEQSGNLDTVIAKFSLTNNSRKNHSFSFRYMLDTFIGSNDGVPFTIPNFNGLCNTFANFNTTSVIPEYIEALEFPNLANPGTVAHLGTVVSAKHGNFAPMSQVLLTAWPGINCGWLVPIDPFRRDSAIVMYWKPAIVKPGESYECAFSYGLQPLTKSVGANGIAISTGGVFEKGKNAIIIAYVDQPKIGDFVTLDLPEGLKISTKTPVKQKVKYIPGQPYGQVTWQIKLEEDGMKKVTISRSNGVSLSKEIRVR
ncbi:MAG: hypothetical protein EBT92_11215 [Planctomycetes bacterium]|nr:hypothetical protein [Planctomycetota bacterium]